MKKNINKLELEDLNRSDRLLLIAMLKNAERDKLCEQNLNVEKNSLFDKELKKNKVMRKNEIIVLSIVIGVIFASILGYFFGENIFTSTVTGERVGPNTTSVEIKESILPNYQIGSISFIISAGITYLISNRFVKN